VQHLEFLCLVGSIYNGSTNNFFEFAFVIGGITQKIHKFIIPVS